MNDDEMELDDEELASEAEVTCPYCGESVLISLDPDGGLEQEYIQDCEICCRPWRVLVSYSDEGKLDVSVEASD